MRNFIAIDFETASEQRTTPVSIGIAKIENNEIDLDKTFFSLINPRTTIFNQISIGKHGLTYDMVKDAPDFVEIWNKVLKSLVADNIVIVHQTASDISVIRKCIELYELDQVNFEYISTLEIAKNLHPEIKPCGMKELCRYYGISYLDDHKSDTDAIALAKLFIELSKHVKFNLYSYLKNAFNEKSTKNNFYTEDLDDIEQKYEVPFVELKNLNFKDKTFLIFGKSIDSFPISKIEEKIKDKGGIIKYDISSKLDFLIAGTGVGSAILTKIDALNSSGMSNIKIIPLFYIIEL